jgi:hypothetical protein
MKYYKARKVYVCSFSLLVGQVKVFIFHRIEGDERKRGEANHAVQSFKLWPFSFTRMQFSFLFTTNKSVDGHHNEFFLLGTCVQK